MAVVEGLIRAESNGTISFGDYKAATKQKKSDFEVMGDMYKVKTCCEITKLERNEQFVYESVPGTAVNAFEVTEDGVSFTVEGAQDANITLGLEESTEYSIYVAGTKVSEMKTNLSGKLSISVELNEGAPVALRIVRL